MSDSLPPLTPRLRELSKLAFNRATQAEVVLIARTLPKTGFTFEQVYDLALRASRAAGMEEPSESAVRKDLARMREPFGALERPGRARGQLERVEVQRSSSLWKLCDELHQASLEQ